MTTSIKVQAHGNPTHVEIYDMQTHQLLRESILIPEDGERVFQSTTGTMVSIVDLEPGDKRAAPRLERHKASAH